MPQPVTCPTGSYCPATGLTVPTICPAGSFCPTTGLLQPVLCDAGTINPRAGAVDVSACQSCPRGRYNSAKGANSSSYCLACPAGAFGHKEGLAFDSCGGLCLPGFWCPAASTNATAVPCPAGTYGATQGLTTAACSGPCARGFWCGANSTAPVACAPGRYGAASGLTTSACSGECSLGSTCLATAQGGATEEADCPAGSYCSAPDSVPVPCAPGALCLPRSTNGSVPCPPAAYCATPAVLQACPRGFYCPERSVTPLACPVGRYGNVPGLSTAECSGVCAPGTWSNATGVTSQECIPCAPGRFCSTPLAQVDCPAGTYCPAKATAPIDCPLGAFCGRGAVNWTACAPGSYADRPGRPDSACSGQCLPGRYGALAGASHAGCDGPCASGYFCVAGSTNATAQPCPRGSTTEAGAGTKQEDCKGATPREQVVGVTVELVGSGMRGLNISWTPGKSAGGISTTTGYTASCQQMRTASTPASVGDRFVDIEAAVSDAVLVGGRRLAFVPPSALTPSFGYRCRVAPLNGNGIGQLSDWSQPVQWFVVPPLAPSLGTAVQLSRESNAARYITVSGSLHSGENGEAVIMSDATLSVRFAPAAAASAVVSSFNRSSAADGCKGSRELIVTSDGNGLTMWQTVTSTDASEWHFAFKVLLCDQGPYVLAVQVTNVGGAASSWSSWTPPVPTNCSPSTFLEASGLECVGCPDGAACTGAGTAPNASTLVALPNWWRAPWIASASAAFLPCMALDSSGATACSGGGCTDGYRGVLCHECVVGYARSGAVGCAPCGASWRTWLALVGVAVLSAGVLALLVRAALRSRGEPSRLEIVMLKVLLAHLQTVALAAEFDLRWPAWLAGFFAVFDASSSLSDAVLSLDCVLPASVPGSGAAVISGAALTLCAPLFCAAAAALYWGVRAVFRPVPASAYAMGVGLVVTEEHSPQDALAVSVIVVLSTLHASLSKATLRLLTCRSLGGRKWLAADMAVECWAVDSPQIRYGLALAIPALLMFVLGIPVGNFALLWRRRHKLARPEMRAKFGFLYASYREPTFFWDAVVLLRKFTIAVVAVFLRPAGSGLQALAAQITTLLFLSLQFHVEPYADARLNALEANALRAELATFSLSILLYAAGADDGLKAAASLSILGVNLAYLSYFFSVFFRESLVVRAGAGRVSAAAMSARFRVTSAAASLSFRVRGSTRLTKDVDAVGSPRAAIELTDAAGAPQLQPSIDHSVGMVINPLVARPSRAATLNSGASFPFPPPQPAQVGL